jgi:rubrerythrin
MSSAVVNSNKSAPGIKTPGAAALIPAPAFRAIAPVTLPNKAAPKSSDTDAVGGGDAASHTLKDPNTIRAGQANATFATASVMEGTAPTGTKGKLPVPFIPLCRSVRNPTTHDERVGLLLRTGWKHDDIINALEASKNEKGEEDYERAHEYLDGLREWRLQQINKSQWQVAAQALESPDEQPDKIKADSELALYIAVNPDHIDAVLHMQQVHESSRTAHSADHFRTAANLMANPRASKDSSVCKIAPFAIKKIALAIVNDCEKCGEMRAKEAAAKKEAADKAAKKARDVALKAEQEEKKLRKEAEEKRKRDEAEAKRPRTPPLPSSYFTDDGDDTDIRGTVDFDTADCVWSSKKRRGICWDCGEGDLGGENSLLLVCEVCSHLFHKACTDWAKVQHDITKQIKWACLGCVRTPPARWKLINPKRKDPPSNTSTTITPCNPARNLFSNRPGERAGGGDRGGGTDAAATPAESTIFDEDLTLTGLSNEDKLSFKVKAYTMWDPLPAGHKLTEPEHPTKGFGKIAYQNWKKTNISVKDQSRGKLGPLATALTTEMRRSVGNALLQCKEVRPKPYMTETEVTQWIRSDPEYTWVKKLADATLIKLLDTHFSVLDPDPFLAMRFPSNIPLLLPDGLVNYMTVPHSAFAEQWLNCLTELRQGGWDDSMTDLRQAYITALEPCPTLYNEAVRYRTTSHDLLISYLRSWTQRKASEQAADKECRNNLKASLQGGAASEQQQQQQQSPSAKKSEPAKQTKEVIALRSEVSKLTKSLEYMKKKDSATPPTGAANEPFFCNGCGYTFQRDGRRIPCENNCVFEGHADQNTGYKKGVPWPEGKRRLFWGTPEDYLAKHGKEMPENGKQYLELRAKHQANKRQDFNPNKKKA